MKSTFINYEVQNFKFLGRKIGCPIYSQALSVHAYFKKLKVYL